MRSPRSALAAVLVVSAAFGSIQIVACGADDSNVTPVVPDASAPSAPGLETTISESRTKIYFGHTARIDGAAIAPNAVTDIVWELVFAPSDSKLTTASLADAATATPHFTPDVLGGYTLRVTGRKDGQASSVFVYVEAVDAPVFWRTVSYKRAGTSGAVKASTFVGGVYGAAAVKEVACAQQQFGGVEGGTPDEFLSFTLVMGRAGGSAGDVWEGPAGTASRVAYADIDFSGVRSVTNEDDSTELEGVVKSKLIIATSDNTCANGDAKVLDTSDFTLSSGNSLELFRDPPQNVRFSPDGSRLAYLRSSNMRVHVATVGIDGSGKRELSPLHGDGMDPDAGPVGLLPSAFARQPRWKDASHVTWVRFVGPTAQTTQEEWEIYSVEDRDGAGAELLMRCSAFGISSYDFLPDGTIVAAVVKPGPAPDPDSPDIEPTQVMDLVVLRANAETKQCEVSRSLTQNTAPGSVARDLALSPDKSKVAFFSGLGNGSGIPMTAQTRVSPLGGTRT